MDCPINATKPLKRKDTAYYFDYIKDDDFLKGLVLSPDGSLLLASSENSCDAVIAELNHDELVSTKYYKNVCDSTSNENTGRLTSDRLLRNFQMFSLGESVYDLKWYPGCTVQDPATCCFVAATKDHPVHLWDTNSQSIRCSYIPKNHMDELDNAISLSFNLTGDKIYMGSNKIIRCFDVACPGTNCTEYKTTATRKSLFGQKGIISCLSFNPDYSGAYAAGSYANSIGVYVENTAEAALELYGLEFGVSHLKWSPCGCYLWAGGRKNDNIICWDLRNTKEEVGRVHRPLDSNQKISFDLDPWGSHLCTGSQDGKVLLFNTKTFELEQSISYSSTEIRSQNSKCINSVVFHPYYASVITLTGERNFTVDAHYSDESTDSDDDSMLDLESLAKKRRKEVDNNHENMSVGENSSNAFLPKEKIINRSPCDVDISRIFSEISLWELSYDPINVQLEVDNGTTMMDGDISLDNTGSDGASGIVCTNNTEEVLASIDNKMINAKDEEVSLDERQDDR